LWATCGVCFLAVFAIEIVMRYNSDESRRKREKEARRQPPPESPAVVMVQRTSETAPAQESEKEQGEPAPPGEPMPIKKLRQRALERQDKRIGEILMHRNFITREDLDKALDHQKRYGGSITQYLLHFGCIDEKQLAQCLSSQFKVPYLPLDAYEISDEIVQSIPVDMAEKYWVMPVDRQGNALMVAMIDPLDTQVIKDLEKMTGLEIIPFVGIISEIVAALRLYYKILSKDNSSKIMKAPPFFIDTKTYTGTERRRAIRYRAGIDIRYPLGGRYFTTRTMDVSRGGFGFLASASLELGALLTVEINLPREISPLPISAVTQVVRCAREKKYYLIGVRMLKISKEENNLIINYASRHRKID